MQVVNFFRSSSSHWFGLEAINPSAVSKFTVFYLYLCRYVAVTYLVQYQIFSTGISYLLMTFTEKAWTTKWLDLANSKSIGKLILILIFTFCSFFHIFLKYCQCWQICAPIGKLISKLIETLESGFLFLLILEVWLSVRSPTMSKWATNCTK